jgi:serine/threonine protein kinase
MRKQCGAAPACTGTETALTSIEPFNLAPGRILAKKYEVVSRLGAGWRGEVYLIREKSTGIERAAKLFFPERNPRNKVAKTYARKLHTLRNCPFVIHYHAEETIVIRRTPITVLISEYVAGELLSGFLQRQPGKRVTPFHALHLLYALSRGIADMHALGEYHGDLHSENVIVMRAGLSFELKVLDLIQWEAPKRAGMQDDICDVIRLFFDALGGNRWYARQPEVVKGIVKGNKRSLILKRFPTAAHLRKHLETLTWP